MAGQRISGRVLSRLMWGLRSIEVCVVVGGACQLLRDRREDQTAPVEEQTGPAAVEHREELIADAMMAHLRYSSATLVDLRDGLKAGWLVPPSDPAGERPSYAERRAELACDALESMALAFPSYVDGTAVEVQRRVRQAFLDLPSATDGDADSSGVAKKLDGLIKDIEELIETRPKRSEQEWLADAVNLLQEALSWILTVTAAVLAAVVPAEVLNQPAAVEAMKAVISSIVTALALHAQKWIPLQWSGPDIAGLLKEGRNTLTEASATLREGGFEPAGPDEAHVVGRKRLCQTRRILLTCYRMAALVTSAEWPDQHLEERLSDALADITPLCATIFQTAVNGDWPRQADIERLIEKACKVSNLQIPSRLQRRQDVPRAKASKLKTLASPRDSGRCEPPEVRMTFSPETEAMLNGGTGGRHPASTTPASPPRATQPRTPPRHDPARLV